MAGWSAKCCSWPPVRAGNENGARLLFAGHRELRVWSRTGAECNCCDGNECVGDVEEFSSLLLVACPRRNSTAAFMRAEVIRQSKSLELKSGSTTGVEINFSFEEFDVNFLEKKPSPGLIEFPNSSLSFSSSDIPSVTGTTFTHTASLVFSTQSMKTNLSADNSCACLPPQLTDSLEVGNGAIDADRRC